MRSPTISIIVPVYNIEAYVDQCILSLRAQTYDDYEIVIVNDGSTDNSMEHVAGHVALDGRIRIIEQHNRGLGGARNTGLKCATGEFVAFVDGDDFVSARFLHTLSSAQQSGDFDIVSSKFRRITQDCAYLPPGRLTLPENFIPPLSDSEFVLGLFSNSVAWARLYRRSALLESDIRFPEQMPHEDLFFTYKILRCCSRHLKLDDPMYFWRQRPGSLGETTTPAHLRMLSVLRDDTTAFLNHVRASEREKVLSARRNIVLLDMFWERVRERDPSLHDIFGQMISSDREAIIEDLRRINDSGEIAYRISEELRRELVAREFDERELGDHTAENRPIPQAVVSSKDTDIREEKMDAAGLSEIPPARPRGPIEPSLEPPLEEELDEQSFGSSSYPARAVESFMFHLRQFSTWCIRLLKDRTGVGGLVVFAVLIPSVLALFGFGGQYQPHLFALSAFLAIVTVGLLTILYAREKALSLQAELARARNLRRELLTVLKASQARVEQLQEQTKRIKEQRQRLTGELKTARGQVEQLKIDLSSARVELSNARVELSNARDDEERLKGELEIANEILAQTRLRVKDLNLRLARPPRAAQ